ncbi:MAG TPA: Cys-tRNA(Pro) deacylase [Deltaproteobacteria bacterium]|nr:Cys-tRNA(Pro) deacylase [Deltaproteobacteria bacterium]HQI00688.1 Cys-tRNA(Pro) deacylase [Deltaproteobacteria bacterium]HQJ08611.1 Cys-tRNA(Pro) deacylase [Deltaproteobacteria bacterium]
MAKDAYPITQGVRFLRKNGVEFTPCLYPYVDHGGTGRAAEFLCVPEHRVIKTLVMELDERHPIIVLMHGDREVSVRQLARQLGAKQARPCDMKKAERLTGYQVGGISPFGTKARFEIYMEASILELDRIYINGGKRGFLVAVDPGDIERVLKPVKVNVAIEQ